MKKLFTAMLACYMSCTSAYGMMSKKGECYEKPEFEYLPSPLEQIAKVSTDSVCITDIINPSILSLTVFYTDKNIHTKIDLSEECKYVVYSVDEGYFYPGLNVDDIDVDRDVHKLKVILEDFAGNRSKLYQMDFRYGVTDLKTD